MAAMESRICNRLRCCNWGLGETLSSGDCLVEHRSQVPVCVCWGVGGGGRDEEEQNRQGGTRNERERVDKEKGREKESGEGGTNDKG